MVDEVYTVKEHEQFVFLITLLYNMKYSENIVIVEYTVTVLL